MSSFSHNREITIAWGVGPKGGDWTNATGTVSQLFDVLATPGPQHVKEGSAFLQVALKEGHHTRKGDDVEAIELVAYDVESGEKPEPIVARLAELGWASLVIPTFKDGMGKTTVTVANLRTWSRAAEDAEVDASVAAAWFAGLPYAKRVNPKTPKFIPAHAVEVRTKGSVPDQYVIEHDPLPRFRVIIALNRRVLVSELGAALDDQAAGWRAFYYEIGRQVGIEAFDEKCSDLNRLYYAHRRPEGVESWHHRVDGQGLDFDAVVASLDVRPKSAQADDRTQQSEESAEAPADQFHDTSMDDDGEIDDERFLAFWQICRHRLNAAQLLLARGTSSSVKSDGKVEAKCPFETGHASAEAPSNRPCCGYDAGSAQHATATIMCHHNSCKDRRPIDFAWALLGGTSLDEWGSFLTAEGQKTFAIWRKTLAPTEDEIAVRVEKLSFESKDSDVSEVIKLLARCPKGTFRTGMVRSIASKTRWSKAEVENSLKAESKSFEEERESAEEVINRRRPPKAHKDKDLPPGFWRHDGKICHRQDKRTIEVITNFVVTARVRDEAANSWGTEIEFSCDGKQRALVILDRELQKDDDGLRARLADVGLKPNTEAKALFRVLMNGLRSDRRLMRVSVPGWHGTAFHAPNGQTVKE